MLFIIPVAPVIRERPKIVTVTKKRTIIIECRVQSQSQPQVFWQKETRTVREDSRHVIHIKESGKVIRIINNKLAMFQSTKQFSEMAISARLLYNQ
jgi:hypothetical protein